MPAAAADFVATHDNTYPLMGYFQLEAQIPLQLLCPVYSCSRLSILHPIASVAEDCRPISDSVAYDEDA